MKVVSDKSEEIKKARFDVKCERCGWRNRLYYGKYMKNYRVCKGCGYLVFLTKKDEFLYRLREKGVKVWKN